MLPTGDSWQTAAGLGAVLLVLLKAWHGWKLGVVRQAVGLVALVGAGMVGVFGGAWVAPLLADVTQVPPAARASWGGLGLGLVVYLGVTLVSAIVFKKTEHQSVGVIRFGYGLAGALLGAVVGLILAGALAVGILVVTGRPEVLAHLRRLDFQKALDSASTKTENAPARPRRAAPR